MWGWMNITYYVGSIVYREAHGMPKLLPTISYLLASLATYAPCLSVVVKLLFFISQVSKSIS